MTNTTPMTWPGCGAKLIRADDASATTPAPQAATTEQAGKEHK